MFFMHSMKVLAQETALLCKMIKGGTCFIVDCKYSTFKKLTSI